MNLYYNVNNNDNKHLKEGIEKRISKRAAIKIGRPAAREEYYLKGCGFLRVLEWSG